MHICSTAGVVTSNIQPHIGTCQQDLTSRGRGSLLFFRTCLLGKSDNRAPSSLDSFGAELA